jgi:hypothetical protein
VPAIAEQTARTSAVPLITVERAPLIAHQLM